MIKTKSKLAFAIAALNIICTSVYADTLSFNYQFGDGTTVNGELTGTAISPTSFAAIGIAAFSVDETAMDPSTYSVTSYGWAMSNITMSQDNPGHIWSDPVIYVNMGGSEMDLGISSNRDNHIRLGFAVGGYNGEAYSIIGQGSCTNAGTFITEAGEMYCENRPNNTYKKQYTSSFYSPFEPARWNAQITNSPAPAPVPEPETYAMMLAGLGAVGAMTRRRQKITERTCNATT